MGKLNLLADPLYEIFALLQKAKGIALAVIVQLLKLSQIQIPSVGRIARPKPWSSGYTITKRSLLSSVTDTCEGILPSYILIMPASGCTN